MRKTLSFLIIIAVLCAPFISAERAINITPTAMQLKYVVGQALPVIYKFNITNVGNTTAHISSDFLDIPSPWFSLSTIDSQDLDAGDVIPVELHLNTAPSDSTYTYIAVHPPTDTNVTPSDFIPINLNVTHPASLCRLEPSISSYIKTIKSGTNPFTTRISIRVSNDCCNVEFPAEAVQIQNVITTSDGDKPIALEGAVDLGTKGPGESGYFDIQFDVNGLSPDIYQPQVYVVGYDCKGNKVEALIPFKITVSTTTTPSSAELNPPKYEIPDQVKVGENFDIKVTDLDPRLSPQLFFNKYLIGVGVDDRGTKGDEWVWTGYINTTGDFPVSITSTYRGGNIGPVFTKTIKVVQNVLVGSGNLSFDICTDRGCGLSTNDVRDGENVSILVRDSGSKNIVPGVILYVNGQKNVKQSFTVHSGRKYVMSATHPNYPTLDATIEVQQKEPLVFVQCDNTPCEIGDKVNVLAKDPIHATPLSNATITLDGVKVKYLPFTISSVGLHTIGVGVDGYDAVTKDFNVTDRTQLFNPPEQISKGRLINITLSKVANWMVLYAKSEEQNSPTQQFATGSTNSISFKPTKSGIYSLYANGKFLKAYKINGLQISNTTLYIIIGIVGGIFLLFLFPKLFKRGGGGRMGFPSGGDFSSNL